jgi:UDP-3-O-[3-hydroxymyristoyl] glucosamine N-acyltransferase
MIAIEYSLSDVVSVVSPLRVVGATNRVITGIESLLGATHSDLSFLGNKRYRSQLAATQAAIVLVGEDEVTNPKDNQAFIVCKNPSLALGLLCDDIERKYFPKRLAEVHGSAVVAQSARFGENIYIGPHTVLEEGVVVGDGVTIGAGCYIGHGVTIGDGSQLHAGVKVMSLCAIGRDVVLHPGVVIGSDGFGYETVDAVHRKLPQIGNVIIGDAVEIGANTTIDRARFSSTKIGTGTKIDNLVQIGHNVTIGKHCLIVAQVGIAGSATIGDYVIIGGQSGIAGHVHIGDKTMVAAQTGIASSCKPGSFLRGSPAMPYNEANKFLACRKRLAQLLNRVRNIEDKFEL